MTLVHLHFHGRRTGVTRHVEDVVRALSRAGAKAWGWGLGADVPRSDFLTVWQTARRGGLVLHVHRNLELLLALSLRAVGKRVRVVWTRHSAKRPSRLTTLLASRADVRVTLTEEGARTLGLPSVVVTHGVDTLAFSVPKERAAAWGALGVGGKYGLAVVGRIRPEKGQGDAVAALFLAFPDAPEWRGVLVGEARGADKAWLRTLLGPSPSNLVAVGEQADVRPWYQGATVVVQPSHTESFSLVLLEAMASGCCVVAANLPHYSAILEEGRTGFTYPVGQVEGLAAILKTLFAEPETAASVGRNAAQAVRSRFPLEREVTALEQLYRGALR